MSQTLDDFAISPSAQDGVTRDSFPGHVLAEILRTSGPQPACPRAGEILTAFWDRLGPDRALTATELAFGRFRGFWHSAPVTPLRFAEGQDDFFALRLLEAGPRE